MRHGQGFELPRTPPTVAVPQERHVSAVASSHLGVVVALVRAVRAVVYLILRVRPGMRAQATGASRPHAAPPPPPRPIVHELERHSGREDVEREGHDDRHADEGRGEYHQIPRVGAVVIQYIVVNVKGELKIAEHPYANVQDHAKQDTCLGDLGHHRLLQAQHRVAHSRRRHRLAFGGAQLLVDRAHVHLARECEYDHRKGLEDVAQRVRPDHRRVVQLLRRRVLRPGVAVRYRMHGHRQHEEYNAQDADRAEALERLDAPLQREREHHHRPEEDHYASPRVDLKEGRVCLEQRRRPHALVQYIPDRRYVGHSSTEAEQQQGKLQHPRRWLPRQGNRDVLVFK